MVEKIHRIHESVPLIIYETSIPGYSEKLKDMYNRHSFNYETGILTGEANGKVLVHKDCEFKTFFSEVKKKIEDYLDIFKFNKEIFDINFVKSWYAFCSKEFNIPLHHHSCSHISYVYYIEVEENDPLFLKFENPNEWFGDAFMFCTQRTNLNSWGYSFHPKKESLLIFPGKLLHGTNSSRKNERISIAGDIILTLKDDQLNFESGILPSNCWSQF